MIEYERNIKNEPEKLKIEVGTVPKISNYAIDLPE